MCTDDVPIKIWPPLGIKVSEIGRNM